MSFKKFCLLLLLSHQEINFVYFKVNSILKFFLLCEIFETRVWIQNVEQLQKCIKNLAVCSYFNSLTKSLIRKSMNKQQIRVIMLYGFKLGRKHSANKGTTSARTEKSLFNRFRSGALSLRRGEPRMSFPSWRRRAQGAG